MPRPTVVVAAVAVAILLLAAGLPPAAAADDVPVVSYRPPVAGPIVDRFDLPEKRWQAGNRGIDYSPAPGTPITAAADGEVVFAGDVGGALHVTLRHADGLRTSYSFLAEVAVHQGQKVRAGEPVGVAGGPFHFGVRTPDGTYLDPEALLAGTLRPHVRLVPGAEDGLDPLGERRSLLDALRDTGAGALAWAAEHGSQAIEIIGHYAWELTPAPLTIRVAQAMIAYGQHLRECTSASEPTPVPEERRIAVIVSGLGTGSSGANSAWEIDTRSLGYDDADVVRFSYNGGRAPGPGAPAADGGTRPVAHDGQAEGLASIPVREFSKQDSQQSLPESAGRLEQLLHDVAAAEPGVPIDVIAHSQGGVVARLGVVQAGVDGSLPAEVQNLVTLGSPHQGAPLATAAVAAQQTPGGNDLLSQLRGVGPFGDLDDRLPAIAELSETSDVLEEMRQTPIPDGVRFTSIGSSGDLIVPGGATADPHADAQVLEPMRPWIDSHGDLTTDPRAMRDVALAIAGKGPTCQTPWAAGGAFIEATVVREVESRIGLATGVAGVELTAAGAVTAPVTGD